MKRKSLAITTILVVLSCSVIMPIISFLMSYNLEITGNRTNSNDEIILRVSNSYADFEVDSTIVPLGIGAQFTFTGYFGEEYVDMIWDFGDGTTISGSYSNTSYGGVSYPPETVMNPTHYYQSKGIYQVILTLDYSHTTKQVEVIDPVDLAIMPLDDISFNEGTTGNTISWIVVDANYPTPEYEVLLDGIKLDEGTWESAIPITLDLDGLDLGSHEFKITVTDGEGNEVEDSVIMTKNDLPKITPHNDMTFYEGTLEVKAFWTITDEINAFREYYITINGGLRRHGFWTSGNQISYNFYGVEDGVHSLIITANDGLGGFISDEIIITVNSLISHPEDINFYEGATGNSISWIITNDILVSRDYAINIDGNLYKQGQWSSGIPIDFNLDGLNVGLYSVEIVILNDLGQLIVDKVLAHVLVPVPIADFEAEFTEIEPGDFVKFHFNGSIGKTPATFYWDFGDGNILTHSEEYLSVKHTYTDEGNYTISLTLIDANGVSSVMVREAYISVSTPPLPPEPFPATPGIVIGMMSAFLGVSIFLSRKISIKKGKR